MQVILLEKIRNLGELGEEVHVKAGYGRNFLIPQNKAVFATEQNREVFEQRRSELVKKAEQAFAKAEQRAAKINDITLNIEAQATEEGKLYGSIGVAEIANALGERSVEVDKKEVVLSEGPLHEIGEYVVDIQLHSEVIAKLQVVVAAAK